MDIIIPRTILTTGLPGPSPPAAPVRIIQSRYPLRRLIARPQLTTDQSLALRKALSL